MAQILRDVVSGLGSGLRLALWLPVPQAVSPDSRPVRPGAVVVAAMLWLSAVAAIQALLAGPEAVLNPYGLSASIAAIAVFVGLLIVAGAGATRVPMARALLVILSAAIVVVVPVIGVLAAAGAGFDAVEALSHYIADAGYVGTGLAGAWALLVAWRTGRVLWGGDLRLPGFKLVAAAMLSCLLLPIPPIVYGSNVNWPRIDVWHGVAELRTWLASDGRRQASRPRRPRIDVETVYYRQPALVKAALERIEPSPPGRPQLYFLAAAAYAGQDVFKREVEGARAVLDSRFGTAGRSIALVNYRDTIDRLPLANVSNLEMVLEGVARKMDRDKDILVLYITTHGTKGLLAVDFPGFALNNLTPERLAGLLDASGIRNRVLIISACHSGSFIPALSSVDALVMTAAHAEKTSFGCENGRDWTYFGDALFNRALRSTHSFTKAFEMARATIAGWERKEELEPSEPQISIGSRIAARLEAVARDLDRRQPEKGLQPSP